MGKHAERTIIGVVASQDSYNKNQSLVETFEKLWGNPDSILREFHFLFTGGTFRRVVLGDSEFAPSHRLSPVSSRIRKEIMAKSTVLPGYGNGGIVLLANYIVSRQCSILWAFWDPGQPHLGRAENLALMRLCDVWKVNRLMNHGSVVDWYDNQALSDISRNLQAAPPDLVFQDRRVEAIPKSIDGIVYHAVELADVKTEALKCNSRTIALIAHDELKNRMIDFAVQYERELGFYSRILATRTTGRRLQEATGLKNIVPYRSGVEGGDIQIATEILAGRCDVVVFFVDPLHPQPHADDIRTVFAACMIENNVRMLTNEVQAREWMDEVVRKRHSKLR